MTLFLICAKQFSTRHNRQGEEKGVLDIHTHQIRDYTKNRQKQVDDYPYGGGMGMVMTAQPIADCFRAVCEMAEPAPPDLHVPAGSGSDPEKARDLAKLPAICILCGHYEGVDQRVIDAFVDEEISIGDYVVTGGELPALVLIDCIARMVPGVCRTNSASPKKAITPACLNIRTTPARRMGGQAVPEILLTGNHAKIAQWRREQALKRTYSLRPDLLEHADLSVSDLEFLENLKSGDCKT